MAAEPTVIAGIGVDNLSAQRPSAGVLPNRKWLYHGQTGNTVVGNVGNQGIGTVALPALAAGAAGAATVTITDSLITTTSIVLVTVRRGTTAPAAGAVATILASVEAPAAGSVVVDVVNLGTAATLATDYVLHYVALN